MAPEPEDTPEIQVRKALETMKRLIMILALLAIPGVALAVTCYTIGDYTDCSDGSSIYRSGNITIIDPPNPPPTVYPSLEPRTLLPEIGSENESNHEHSDDSDGLFQGFEGFKGWDD